MMMALDMFIFEIGTLPYQQLSRKWGWRHAQADRFGALPAAQFLGPGANTISLTGALYPGVAGDFSAIERIAAMADTGEQYILLNGQSEVMGEYFIRSLELRTETFFVDGMARKGDFTLELEEAPPSA
jgi:phage protein U